MSIFLIRHGETLGNASRTVQLPDNPLSPRGITQAELLARRLERHAQEILGRPANQAIVTREGARDVIRGLAAMVLAGPAVDSARYKEIVAELRAATGHQGQKLFYPVRLALAGRAGGGPLDR